MKEEQLLKIIMEEKLPKVKLLLVSLMLSGCATQLASAPSNSQVELSDSIIDNSVSLEEQFKLLDEAQSDFIKLREKYLLY